ncbi:unnamed protein product, partial [Symbiodinium sp. CCMP2456]
LLDAGSGRLKIFVDIGGDRTTSDICCLLALLEQVLSTLQPKQPLSAVVVVKSKALATAAAEAAGADGTIPEPQLRPWLEGIARKQPASSKQLKKKLARARKAQWQQADDTTWQAFEKQRIQWDALCNEEQAHLISELLRLKQEHPEAFSASDCFFSVVDSELEAWAETLRSMSEVVVKLPGTKACGCRGYVGSCCDLVAGGVSALTAQLAFGATRNEGIFMVAQGCPLVAVLPTMMMFFVARSPAGAFRKCQINAMDTLLKERDDASTHCKREQRPDRQLAEPEPQLISVASTTFCDSWGILGRTDHMGEAIRANVNAEDMLHNVEVDYETATVDELMYFSQPDIAVLVMILVVGVVVQPTVRLMKIFDVRCDCSALMPARQDDDADLYDPDDPASDWGEVVQEAALEEARKKRQRNCKGWIQERTASLQEKFQRISKCIRRGKKKEPESPASGRGEAKVRRMTSKSSQGRGASQSVVRTSSKLSRGSRGSRGRSPSKGFQGTGRAESKSSRGSRGADSDGRSDGLLHEDEDEQEELPAKSETRRVSATISKEVPEVFEEKRATSACFPPGFVWEDGTDPTLVDNLEKYLKWEATGKELEDVEERDIHPGFHAGNLKGMARLARQQHQSLLLPIVEPMTGRSAKSHSYSADTLYYSCSTLRESRRKKRKRGAIKGPGGKQMARALKG